MDTDIDPALVGARLRRWRNELNLTGPDVAAQVADKSGRTFDWPTLRSFEQGEAVPDESTADSLAAVLGRSVAEVLSAKTDAEHAEDDLVLNPDGADDRPEALRDRSPYRPGRAHGAGGDPDWKVEPGEHITRVALHQQYGGGRQSTIAPCRETKNVLVFSDPTATDPDGRFDRWNAERTVFFFCGEGKQGDQQLNRGNRALREHVKDRRRLRLFEGRTGNVIYAGEFTLDADHPFDWETVGATGDDPGRRMITFRLLPVT